VPHYELTEPAVDRYRDYAGIGAFDMSEYEVHKEKAEEKAAEVKKAAPAADDETVAFPQLTCVPERDLMMPPALDRYRDFAGIGPFDPDDVDDECFDHRRLGFPVPNCKCTFCTLKAEKKRPASKVEDKKDPCSQPTVQTLYIEQPVYREPTYDKERLFKEKNIKALEPFGAVFRKDEQFEDDGLQPPDPFKEHPVDRDYASNSPMESRPDDPTEEPVVSPECCDEPTPQSETCEEVTPDESTPETKPQQAESGSLCITGEDPFPDTGEDIFPKTDPLRTTSEEAKDVVLPAAEKQSETFSEQKPGDATAEEEATQEAQAEEAAEEAHIEQAPAAAAEEPTDAEPEAKEETKEDNAEGTAAEGEEEQAPASDVEPAAEA